MPDATHDMILDKIGLESIDPRAEAVAPEVIRDGHRVWLSIVISGRRQRLCEISLLRAARLNRQLAEAVEALAGQ
jgi:hypothetical protein